jgi:hypothetical protein
MCMRIGERRHSLGDGREKRGDHAIKQINKRSYLLACMGMYGSFSRSLILLNQRARIFTS